MGLQNRLRFDFSSGVRSRGWKYFSQGRVRILSGSADAVAARVRGTSGTYEQSLEWIDEVLYADCECPFFESEGACKHLWAVILQADANHYLSQAAEAGALRFDCGVGDFQQEPPDHGGGKQNPPRKPPPTPWSTEIANIRTLRLQTRPPADEWPVKRQLAYIVEAPSSTSSGCLVISLGSRDRKGDGSYANIKALNLKPTQIERLPLAEDREILAKLGGGMEYYGYGAGLSYQRIPKSLMLTEPLSRLVIPMAAKTGRCFTRMTSHSEEYAPLTWDDGEPWRFRLKMSRGKSGEWQVSGALYRREERMDLSAAVLMTGSFVFTRESVARMSEDTPFEWVVHLRRAGPIRALEKDKEALLGALLSAPGRPELEAPDELSYEEITLQPRPGLQVRSNRNPAISAKLRADLSFDYDGWTVRAEDAAAGIYQADKRCFVRRHVEAEKCAADLLIGLGAQTPRTTYWDRDLAWEIAPSKLPRIARALLEVGWRVEAQGKVFRRPGAFHFNVSSGVDWFELDSTVKYGETCVKLPALLEALRRGENLVRLDDGAYGLLPEEWLRRIGMLAGMGTQEDGGLRFRRSQAGLLDALLAAQPEASCDETFTRIRQELRLFDGVSPANQPAGFVGSLRDYQCQGLGWMEFLRRFSFGGCLADDMGVGKTAQALALLETRRALRAAGGPEAPCGPSLAVVPRSLIFNWKQEAARFTPQLRVLDFTGAGRDTAGFQDADLVLTTYGTLRRDAANLKDFEFDYVLLDEAQAIKNSSTDAAKAARLLRSQHRLALSGTPIENHLGELWSLFEFLNPGMLGAASALKLAGGADRTPDEESRRLLARALRPFILRRTKQEVARELPPKTEQTIYCEMKSVQRKLYDELRQHYRDALLKRIETEGLAKSKIQVLEALLRLRQAACHPGLIDAGRSSEPSAKLEALIEQLREIVEEGHKALVFSQFTSLLRIVRNRLDGNSVTYAYLDGATRDRQARVERFQNDESCRLFLISLKAGGLGLNLTAAEYVFLLDPWWNPAVEAQAIDRTHRIGQTRPVFAYRLIARDTVEEKILELQQSKTDLAASIINADNNLMKNLRREDLELLLS